MASKSEIIERLDVPALIRELVPTAKQAGREMSGLCPFHDDHNASLSVNPESGSFKCHACGNKGSIFDLYGKIHGLDFKGSIQALEARAGLASQNRSATPIIKTTQVQQRVTGRYDFHDADGSLLYWKERLEPGQNGRSKEFRFYHADRQKGRGCDAVLYALHKVLAADAVIINEGEKQADIVNGWKLPGIAGTTLDSGSQSTITKGMVDALTGKRVAILRDNDDPGLAYALNLAKALHGHTASLKVVLLPGLPHKGDLCDSDKTTEEVLSIIEQTPEWTPDKKEPEGVTKFKVIDADSFMRLEFPPRENILAPWLPQQGLTMLYAGRGIGKTHFSLGVAYAVASGGKFLNWVAPRPRGVLFLDGEMPAAALQERIARIAASSDFDQSAPFRIVTPDLQPSRMIDLSRQEDQRDLEPYFDDIDLIIADNLSTLCRNGKENEGEAWLPVQAWALQQRAAGRSVLFIHHAGKNGSQRGSSRREDVLDTVINLRRPNDYTPDQGATFEVHFEKARGIYGEETKPFEARLTTTPDGLQLWTTMPLEESTVEKVAALIREGVQQHEIAEMLGVTKGAISKAKKKATALGLIS